MILTPTALALIGLLLAAWTMAALWVVLSARGRERKAEAGLRNARRLARMVDESPALPLLVRADGRIDAPQRLAGWLGLDSVPQFLTELDGGRIDGAGGGLTKEQLEELSEAVRRCQRTANPFRMVITPHGSKRSLALRFAQRYCRNHSPRGMVVVTSTVERITAANPRVPSSESSAKAMNGIFTEGCCRRLLHWPVSVMRSIRRRSLKR